MRRRVIIAGLVLISGLFAASASAQTWYQREQQTCSSRGMLSGVRGVTDSNNCYPGVLDATNKTNGIVCAQFSNACCVNSGIATCLAMSAVTTPAASDNTRAGITCAADEHLVFKGAVASCEKNPVPLTFTPNVDIPGLFEGTTYVDSSLFARYVGAFFIYFIGVVGVLAVVMMMWGGYHYIVSAGNAQKVKQGKEIIVNALIGLTLALTSFLLLSLINPELVSFRGIVPVVVSDLFRPEEEIVKPTRPPSSVAIGDMAAIGARVQAHPDWINEVRIQAAAYNVEPERLMAILFIESAGVPTAISSAGACGLMQVLPSTAGVGSCNDIMDPIVNIRAGAKYFGALFRQTCPNADAKHQCNSGNPCTNGDYVMVNAGYNGGLGANYCSKTCPGQTYWQCTGNPRYQQTRDYVVKAEAAYQWLKSNSFFGS